LTVYYSILGNICVRWRVSWKYWFD